MQIEFAKNRLGEGTEEIVDLNYGRLAPSPFRPNSESFRPSSKSFRPNSKSFRPNSKSFLPNLKLFRPVQNKTSTGQLMCDVL